MSRAPGQNHAALMHAALRARTLGRIEDYLWLRREQRLSREAAARRLGVSVRTAERYEQRARGNVAA